jgi:hypothetical protein
VFRPGRRPGGRVDDAPSCADGEEGDASVDRSRPGLCVWRAGWAVAVPDELRQHLEPGRASSVFVLTRTACGDIADPSSPPPDPPSRSRVILACSPSSTPAGEPMRVEWKSPALKSKQDPRRDLTLPPIASSATGDVAGLSVVVTDQRGVARFLECRARSAGLRRPSERPEDFESRSAAALRPRTLFARNVGLVTRSQRPIRRDNTGPLSELRAGGERCLGPKRTRVAERTAHFTRAPTPRVLRFGLTLLIG